MGNSEPEDPARRALDTWDAVLREKPHAQGRTWSEATKALATLRDQLIDAGVTTKDARHRLEHVNAVISIALSGHFPLGEVQWKEIKAARGWLAGLVETDGAVV